MLGSASPRKPSVRIAARSAAVRILLVAWRSRQSSASSRSMPLPSSTTRMSEIPPRRMITSIARARIDAVFDQLLHHRRGPFDHLARRHLAGESVGKKANAAHASLNFRIRPRDCERKPSLGQGETPSSRGNFSSGQACGHVQSKAIYSAGASDLGSVSEYTRQISPQVLQIEILVPVADVAIRPNEHDAALE